MKLTKKLTAMAMAVLMAASLMACGGKEASEPAAADTETQEPAADTSAAEDTEDTAADETEDAATDAAEDAADQVSDEVAAGGNIGVCIYKFDDAFMTTYRMRFRKS